MGGGRPELNGPSGGEVETKPCLMRHHLKTGKKEGAFPEEETHENETMSSRSRTKGQASSGRRLPCEKIPIGKKGIT